MSGIWMGVKPWIPFAKVFPLSSFRTRQNVKSARFKFNMLKKFFPVARAQAAQQVGDIEGELAEILLNRNSPIGDKDSLIRLPKDEVIFAEVRDYGRWEINEVAFLTKSIDDESKTKADQKILLDIGANTGLISLQVLRKSRSVAKAVLVEPIPSHIQAIQFNLDEISKVTPLELCPFALGAENIDTEIFTEGRNHGNTSLIRRIVPIQDSTTSRVAMMDVKFFAQTYLNGEQRIILKCDTQGFDAEILSRLPEVVWDRVDAAVIEIWALPEIDANSVAVCLERWRSFSYLSWEGGRTGKVGLAEVEKFWTSKSHATRNLFIKL